MGGGGKEWAGLEGRRRGLKEKGRSLKGGVELKGKGWSLRGVELKGRGCGLKGVGRA